MLLSPYQYALQTVDYLLSPSVTVTISVCTADSGLLVVSQCYCHHISMHCRQWTTCCLPVLLSSYQYALQTVDYLLPPSVTVIISVCTADSGLLVVSQCYCHHISMHCRQWTTCCLPVLLSSYQYALQTVDYLLSPSVTVTISVCTADSGLLVVSQVFETFGPVKKPYYQVFHPCQLPGSCNLSGTDLRRGSLRCRWQP